MRKYLSHNKANVMPLGSVCSVQNGYAFSSKDYRNHGVPIIRIGNITNGNVCITETTAYCTKKSIDAVFWVEDGDTLIAMSGATVGKTGIYNYSEVAYLNQRVGKFVSKDTNKLIKGYIKHLVSSRAFHSQIKTLLSSSAQPNISTSQIESLLVPIPDVETQHVLTKVLDKWDKAIDLIDKLISSKKMLKQALMQKLLTGQIRFLGFGKPVTSKGDLPDCWENSRSGNLCSIKYGAGWSHVKSDTGYPVYGTGGQIGYASQSISETPAILIGRKGTIDKPIYIDHPFWAVDTTFYAQATGVADLKYVFYQLSITNWKKYNEASGVPSLNINTISSIEIPIPIVEEQRRIVFILDLFESEIRILNTEIELYRAAKTHLLKTLFSNT